MSLESPAHGLRRSCRVNEEGFNMKSKFRISRALLVVALLVSLSSCPRTPQVELGVWIFEVNYDGASTSFIGAELGANGTLQTPNPLPPEATSNRGFVDPVSWSQDGSTITLLEDHITARDIVYTGTVESSTSIIDGIWTVVDTGQSGTWTAVKL